MTLHNASVLPAPAGRIYLRLFVLLLQPMTDGHNTFFVADLFSMPGGGNAARIGEDYDMLMMTVGGDAHGFLSNQNYFNDHMPGVRLSAGAWTCVEMLFDAPHTEIDTWVDGVEVPDMHPTNIVHLREMRRAAFGDLVRRHRDRHRADRMRLTQDAFRVTKRNRVAPSSRGTPSR